MRCSGSVFAKLKIFGLLPDPPPLPHADAAIATAAKEMSHRLFLTYIGPFHLRDRRGIGPSLGQRTPRQVDPYENRVDIEIYLPTRSREAQRRRSREPVRGYPMGTR